MILVADLFEKIIVGGGSRRVEVFNYNANRVMVSGRSLEDEWLYAIATPLYDGRVFIAGGYNDSLYPTNQTLIFRLPDGAKTKLQARNPHYDALAVRCRR
jgi:hypothetical protein